ALLPAAVLLLALSSAGTLPTPVAEANPGDVLRTINVAPAPSCFVSVGVEFVVYQPSNDAELLVTCASDFDLTRVDEGTGANLGTITVTGMIPGEGIGAITFDASTNTLWLG